MVSFREFVLRKRYGNRIDVTWIPCECTNSIIIMFVAVNLFSFCAMLPLRVMCEWTLVIITDTNAMCNCLLFAQRVFYNINHERYFLQSWMVFFELLIKNIYTCLFAPKARKKSGIGYEKVRNKSPNKKSVGSCYFAQIDGTRTKLSIACGLIFTKKKSPT